MSPDARNDVNAGLHHLLLSQFADNEEKTSRILSFMGVKELKEIPASRFEALISQLENQLVSNG